MLVRLGFEPAVYFYIIIDPYNVLSHEEAIIIMLKIGYKY